MIGNTIRNKDICLQGVLAGEAFKVRVRDYAAPRWVYGVRQEVPAMLIGVPNWLQYTACELHVS